jgi:hypothetical protein
VSEDDLYSDGSRQCRGVDRNLVIGVPPAHDQNRTLLAAASASARPTPHVFWTGTDCCPATARQNKPGGRSSASTSASSTPVTIVVVVVVALVVAMAQVRSAFAAPTHQDGGKDIPDDVTCTVTFRHPGYPDEHNIIMILPALDHAQGGIHHETALIACAVVAGNRWDGFLSEQRTGSGVLTPRDGVLRGKEYYFRLPDDAKGRYP